MAAPNILSVPDASQRAEFVEGFGQKALLTVDVEEEFDWTKPFDPDEQRVDHVAKLEKFQEFCEGFGVIPLYLLSWPVANSPVAQDVLGNALAAGRAEVGIQLHPWVNPPMEEEINDHNSFPGNLPAELERAKIFRLQALVASKFGANPLVYRAGRYGVGPATANALKDAGIAIDTSVRPLFDYQKISGPDFSQHPAYPYWLDDDHSLLEIPLTSTFWGMLRKQGGLLHPFLSKFDRSGGVLARTGLLERIALTPEGINSDEAIRGIDIALDDGLPLLVFSFHSPSLVPGNTPYVDSEEEVEQLYHWMRVAFGYLAQRGVAPTSVADLIKSVKV